MGKRSYTAARLLALIIIILCVLTGCGKQDDVETKSQQVVAEATVFYTEVPTDQPTTISSPAPSTKPSATLAEEPSSQPTTNPSVTPTTMLTETSTVEVSATAIIEASSVVNATDPPKDSATPKASTEDAISKEPSEGMFDPWYTVKTSIAYSSGTDSEWSYGNQRKEFASSKPCYVRVGSSVVSTWHWGWYYGEGNKIAITYRFTGAEQCIISISDGFATKVETDDPNVIEFTRMVVAKGSEVEDVVVFQYTPKGVGSVSLEVIYDDQVKSQYDERNTVYFINEEDL